MSKGPIGFVQTLAVKEQVPEPPNPPLLTDCVTVPRLWVTMILTIIIVLAVALLVQTAQRRAV